MKIRTGICIFAVVLLIFFLMAWMSLARKQRHTEITAAESEKETQKEEAIAASAQEEPAYEYILKISDGVLVVYKSDGYTIYMETGIRAVGLSDELDSRLRDGIGFDDEESLFAFLESYAS